MQAHVSAFAALSVQRASSSGSSGQGSGQGFICRRIRTSSDYGATSPQAACSTVRTSPCVPNNPYRVSLVVLSKFSQNPSTRRTQPCMFRLPLDRAVGQHSFRASQ